MLTKHEFVELLNRKEKLFDELEVIRAKMFKRYVIRKIGFWVCSIPFVIIFLPIFYFSDQYARSIFIAILYFILFIAICCYIWAYFDPDQPRNNFCFDFKRRVISSIIRLVYENPQYYHSQHISKESLNFYHMFNEKITYMDGDDLVLCKHKDVQLYFCEINSSAGKGDANNDLFKGLLCVVDFHKTFSGQTVVCSKNRTYNKFYNKSAKVDLEDVRFNKLFDTYSSDQITSRYILSHNMMEKIVELKNKWGLDNFVLNFIEGKLFFTISIAKDLFEPSFRRKQRNFEMLYFYYKILELTKSIVDTLNQERRIWSKTKKDSDFTDRTLDFVYNSSKLAKCAICKKELYDDQGIFFNEEKLGYTCGKCYSKHKFKDYNAKQKLNEEFKDWRNFVTKKLKRCPEDQREKHLIGFRKDHNRFVERAEALGLDPFYDDDGLVAGWVRSKD